MMSSLWQIFVKGLNGKTTLIRIDKDASIYDLREKLHEETKIPHDEIRLICGGKEIRDEDDRGRKNFFHHTPIQNESTVFLVLRLRGGSNKHPPADAVLTTEPDMITMDDDSYPPRMKMSCGHAIGPDSLTEYCKSELSNGKHEITCPECRSAWDFKTVIHLAVLTKEEHKSFEMEINENFAAYSAGIQKCPQCKTYCSRLNIKDIRVICPVCTHNNQLYEFCWYCLKQWKSGGTKECGNANCAQERLLILQDAPKKEVIGVPGCPSIRACPKCGLLIEHESDCKHMDCPQPCGQKFCFICLKVAETNGNYKCGSWNTKCEVAPIQKK